MWFLGDWSWLRSSGWIITKVGTTNITLGRWSVFFVIKRTNKKLSAKTLDTLATLESAVIESLRGLCFGRYTWQGVIFLSYVLPYAEKKKQNKQISSFLAALIMILFTLQEQKSHLINLSLNLCWEFVTDVNENLNTHSTNIYKSY